MESKLNQLDLFNDKNINTEEHDRLIRALIAFEKPLNPEYVEKVVNKMIRFLPLINSVITDSPKHGFVWKTRQTNDHIFHRYLNYDYFYNAYMGSNFDPMRQPPIRVLLCDDTIAFIANNCFMDGYALKHLMAIFFDEYKHASDISYISDLYKSEIRSFDHFKETIPASYKQSGMIGHALEKSGMISKLFNKLSKVKVVSNITNGSSKSPIKDEWKNNMNKIKLQLQDFTLADKNFDLSVVHEFVDIEICKKIYTLAAKYKTTISNILTTAYMRAIAITTNSINNNICVSRNYNARGESSMPNYRSFSNLYTNVPFSIKVNEGTIFHQDLEKITNIDNIIKNDHIVAKAICISQESQIEPINFFQIIDYGEFVPKIFSIPNNGIISIYLTPTLENTPYINLGVCEYNGELFLSIANFCHKDDLLKFKNLIANVVFELEKFTYIDDLLKDKKYNELMPQAIAYYADIATTNLQPEIKKINDDMVDISGLQFNKSDETDALPDKIIIEPDPEPVVVAPPSSSPQTVTSQPTTNDQNANPIEPATPTEHKGFFKNIIGKASQISHNVIKKTEEMASSAWDKTKDISHAVAEKSHDMTSNVIDKIKKHDDKNNHDVAPTNEGAPTNNETATTNDSTLNNNETTITNVDTVANADATTNESVDSDQENIIEHYINDFPDLEKESDIPLSEYNHDESIVLQGDYSKYGWNERQIAIAKKYEELTSNIIMPCEDDPQSIKYQIKNKNSFQKRKWIDLMKYVHYKISQTNEK